MRVSICSIVCDIPCSRINLIIISSLSGRIRYLPSKNSYPNCKKMAPYCNGHRMRGVGASFRLTTLLPCFPRPAALWVSRKVEVKYESPRPSKEERGWLHGTDVRGELAWWERKAAAWVRSTLGSQFWLPFSSCGSWVSFSKVWFLWTSRLRITWERACQKCRLSGSTPDLLKQNPNCTSTPEWCVCTLYLERHWPRLSEL